MNGNFSEISFKASNPSYLVVTKSVIESSCFLDGGNTMWYIGDVS